MLIDVICVSNTLCILDSVTLHTHGITDHVIEICTFVSEIREEFNEIISRGIKKNGKDIMYALVRSHFNNKKTETIF